MTQPKIICLSCEEEIRTDQPIATGVIFDLDSQPRQRHIECAFRDVMGGYGHWVDHLHWCGEKHDPDGGLTRRESALKVWAMREEILA